MLEGSGGAFERYLHERYPSPAARASLESRARAVAATARLVDALDEVRRGRHISRTQLARNMQTKPAAISRLLNADQPNPTVRTLVGLLDAMNVYLDVQVREQPANDPDRYMPIQIRPMEVPDAWDLLIDRSGIRGEVMPSEQPYLFVDVVGHGGSHGLVRPSKKDQERRRSPMLMCLPV